MPITPGTRVEGYEVIAPLGRGGMGEIWLARDVALERKVALKVLRGDLTQDPTRLSRFRQEARAASALNHPNVCTIHALGETADGQQFIAMEHVDGDTLRQRMAGSPISLHRAIDIAIQLVSGLTTAHAAGIAHRDLKPENVMLRHDGLVKVLDFGLAKLAPARVTAADATLTELNTDAGTVLGTITYMSPEQARGQEVDARTDIWSLGVMLYEMITGRNPFAAPSSSEVFAAILHREPAPIARSEPDAPAELERIVSKTLRKDREQRYQSTKELLIDLESLRRPPTPQAGSNPLELDVPTPTGGSRTDATMARPQSSAEYIVTGLARHRFAATLIVCLVGAVAAGGWWIVSRRESAPADIRSVVVLPFTMIGEGDGYFADGITEAVTTELGKVGGLRVISSNTAFGYRNKVGNREIARELGVGLVVRGSVQRAGESVRIDVSLIDAGNDTALWSDRYSREGKMRDVLALQDEISSWIAATLSRSFGAQAKPKPPSLVTRNPDAYDAYLRGLWHLKGRSAVSQIIQARVGERRLAVQELERAVALDPNFALARAALASAYTQRFFYDSTDRKLEEEAIRQIDAALAIEPQLAEAFLARAQLKWTAVSGFPHELAIADLQHAVRINPNLAQAYLELEKVYYHIGLAEKAVAANQQAQWLDPAQARSSNRAFRALVDAGKLDDVRFELDSKRELGAFARAEALVAMGKLHEALQLLSESNITVGTDSEYDVGGLALMGLVYARLGQREDAERVIATVMPTAENATALSHMHHAQFHIGATLAWLDRPDEAVKWLTKAAVQGYPSYPKFSTDQSLDKLKHHQGFGSLLARLRRDWDRRRATL